MVLVIPFGLTKKDIPYYAQIIHIADVFDAIVSKRHYKTHISISETLKILLKDAEPSSKYVALDTLHTESKYGKINKRILKVLFKVVIDDTNYEISCIMEYVKYLKDQIKRLNQILQYEEKMQNTKKEKDKNYYKEGMKLLFDVGENFENYKDILLEYKKVLEEKEQRIQKLYNEIKIIKKLKSRRF